MVLVGHDGVGLEHSFEPLAGGAGLVADLDEILEVAGDLRLVLAAETTSSSAVPDVLRSPSAVLHSALALLLLLVATVLAVYKPRGPTPYGQRKQPASR